MSGDRFASECDRCGASLRNLGSIMSRFNTDIICLACEAKERAHPGYAAAEEAERAAVLRGDYNFPGVGAPKDLL